MRARFAKHIAILILVDACASALGYFLFGYAFAFGDNLNEDGVDIQNPFIGSIYFGLHSLPHTSYFLWLFQWSVSRPLADCCSSRQLPTLPHSSLLCLPLFEDLPL